MKRRTLLATLQTRLGSLEAKKRYLNDQIHVYRDFMDNGLAATQKNQCVASSAHGAKLTIAGKHDSISPGRTKRRISAHSPRRVTNTSLGASPTPQRTSTSAGCSSRSSSSGNLTTSD